MPTIVRPPKDEDAKQWQLWFDTLYRLLNVTPNASANVSTTVTGTAAGTYGTPEKDMLNQLKTDVLAIAASLNELKANLRSGGYLKP